MPFLREPAVGPASARPVPVTSRSEGLSELQLAQNIR
jgi:hypothetical protein